MFFFFFFIFHSHAYETALGIWLRCCRCPLQGIFSWHRRRRKFHSDCLFPQGSLICWIPRCLSAWFFRRRFFMLCSFGPDSIGKQIQRKADPLDTNQEVCEKKNKLVEENVKWRPSLPAFLRASRNPNGLNSCQIVAFVVRKSCRCDSSFSPLLAAFLFTS